ncbi:MAG TPA: hypothetical protein VGV37_16915 [Aliidongia sp.]|uniref:hypothetical protein n=1 Tax=Aliidongia sp. TaxID=1914230 RepID=UPI002DDC9A72|nr:hypothetical protein [Aliidongia sp.]HEV2676209.1 hypothetical protein [Aliidongia sp.]
MNSPDERIQRALETVQQSPADLQRWFDLLAILVEFGRHAQVLHVLEQRHQVAGDGMSLTFDGLGRLLLMGQVDAVEAFTAQIPTNHIFTPVTLMLQGWIAAAREESDRAVELIRRAFQIVPAIKDFVTRDMEFQRRNYPQIVNQAEQLGLAAEILALQEPETPPPVMLEPVRVLGGERVVVAAADAGYAKRFSRAFVRSFQETAAPNMLLHLHVVAPDGETDALLSELAREEPRLHVSRQVAGIDGAFPVYCACARFLMAPALIAHYRMPLLLTDIDITFLQPIVTITNAASPFDVALFETGSPFPPLRCSAVAVHLAASPAARHFLTLLTRYLGRMLRSGRHWMLDQSALWSVTRACGTPSALIAYANLTALLQAGWNASIAPIPVTAEEKRHLRRSGAQDYSAA